MSTRATYKPTVPDIAVMSIDLKTGKVRRYVCVQAAAGLKPFPFLTNDFVVEGFDRMKHVLDKNQIEQIRQLGEGAVSE